MGRRAHVGACMLACVHACKGGREYKCKCKCKCLHVVQEIGSLILFEMKKKIIKYEMLRSAGLVKSGQVKPCQVLKYNFLYLYNRCFCFCSSFCTALSSSRPPALSTGPSLGIPFRTDVFFLFDCTCVIASFHHQIMPAATEQTSRYVRTYVRRCTCYEIMDMYKNR